MKVVSLACLVAGAVVLSAGATQARPPAGTSAPAAKASHTNYFQSPTGNIRCRRWVYRRLMTCMTRNNGRLVGVSLYGRSYVRYDGYRYYFPRGPVVRYGRYWRRGGFSCLSRFTGMTCQSLPTGRGFTINRTSFEIW